MAFSIYEASIPVYLRQLNALSAILTKAAAYSAQRKIDPAALINARLYPDMIPLAGQVQAACNHARRGAARLSGAEPERVEDKESTFDELQALIARTVESLEADGPEEDGGNGERDRHLPRRATARRR